MWCGMDGTKGERGKEARDEVREISNGCGDSSKDVLRVNWFRSEF